MGRTALLAVAMGVATFGCGGRETGAGSSSTAGTGSSSTVGVVLSSTAVANSSSTAAVVSSSATYGGSNCDASVVDANPTGAPLYHRPAGGCCPTERGAGFTGTRCGPTVTSCTGGTCWADSDCTDGGTNGRCTGVQLFGCSYDECFSDEGCPTRIPCICRASPTDNTANMCATGSQCAVDSDCGPGGFCSPSPSPAASCAPGYGYGWATGPVPLVGGYACHSAGDTCTNDSDCASFDAGGTFPGRAACIYDMQAQHWACSALACYAP